MTPALKTSGILVAATAISAAALLLSQGKAPAAQEPGTRPAKASGKGLQLQSSLASTHILAGDSDAYMAVSLTAPEQKKQARPKVDLAVVLDRSGSMEGEKLSQAKLAARQLISNLAEQDRFSITVYGTDVEVVFPSSVATEASKRAALMTISEIYTDGGTNLSGGLLAGKSQLLGLSESTGRVQRIVLISDGQANEGIVDRSELSELANQTAMAGVSITTVGVGLDFDEQTMTRIAVSGRGNYYFAESADMLATLFDTELQRLGATVATQVSLRITPKQNVEIREVLGYETQEQGGSYVVNIADMHAGETRKVIVALRVRAGQKGTMELADMSALFTDASKGEARALSSVLSAKITSDLAVVNANRDMQANRLIERALTAKAIDEATGLYEAGRAAEAQSLMDTRAVAAQAIAADLGDMDFEEEMKSTQTRVKQGFAEAPAASSAGGKKARKANRKDAYDLMY